MIRLEYKNTMTTNEWEFIGNFATELDAYNNISSFCKKHNFTIYYYRNWKTEDGWTMVDFGSHIQFYRMKEVPDESGGRT